MSEALNCKLCKYELQGAEDIPCVDCGVNRFEPKEQPNQGIEAKPPRIYDYRDVDLPEVQALIGQQVYLSDELRKIVERPEELCEETLAEIREDRTRPYRGLRFSWQFIRAIDEPPKIKLTRSELIAIAAKSRGVKPEQIIVEE